MTPTPKGAASATPVTDAETLADLVACARLLNEALFDERFHLGTVNGETMVGYLDTATGAFIAATIELHPVLWHSPPGPTKPPLVHQPPTPATATRSGATEAPASADGSDTAGDCWHAKDCHPTPARPCDAYITEALRARAAAGGRCVHGLRAHVIAGVACLPHTCDDTCRYTEHNPDTVTDATYFADAAARVAAPADGTDHGNGTALPPSRCTFGCRGCDECSYPAPVPERLGDCWHATDCHPDAQAPCLAKPAPSLSVAVDSARPRHGDIRRGRP